MGRDLTYIRDQLYVSRVVPGELPLHSNSREMVADSDDEDPDGLREAPLAGGCDGPEGGDVGGAASIFEQSAQGPPVEEHVVPPEEPQTPARQVSEGLQMPIGLEIPLGTIPKVEEEVEGDFMDWS